MSSLRTSTDKEMSHSPTPTHCQSSAMNNVSNKEGLNCKQGPRWGNAGREPDESVLDARGDVLAWEERGDGGEPMAVCSRE